MATAGSDVLDVQRAGRWCQVFLVTASSPGATSQAADQLALCRMSAAFVGVISADLGPELPSILDELQPGLQEIVCFDSLGEPVVTGSDLAWRALDELGFGQDFVYTVPTLEGAIDYAINTLLQPGHGGWEGRLVVVVGSRPVIEQAHRHLTQPG